MTALAITKRYDALNDRYVLTIDIPPKFLTHISRLVGSTRYRQGINVLNPATMSVYTQRRLCYHPKGLLDNFWKYSMRADVHRFLPPIFLSGLPQIIWGFPATPIYDTFIARLIRSVTETLEFMSTTLRGVERTSKWRFTYTEKSPATPVADQVNSGRNWSVMGTPRGRIPTMSAGTGDASPIMSRSTCDYVTDAAPFWTLVSSAGTGGEY